MLGVGETKGGGSLLGFIFGDISVELICVESYKYSRNCVCVLLKCVSCFLIVVFLSVWRLLYSSGTRTKDFRKAPIDTFPQN